MKRNYTFVITKGVHGYFIASVPELPGVMTQAKSIAEIFPRVKEAIEVYLEAVGEENQTFLEKVEFIGVNQIEVEIG